jgi:Ni/Co efflux regulator RcnB
MLKTISAALLAVSVLAAPALAAGQSKATQAPANKTEQAKQVQQTKPKALNANAKMGHHHLRNVRHQRFHRHMGAIKTHQKLSKVSIKHVTPTARRG